jgi:hypothetical protein
MTDWTREALKKIERALDAATSDLKPTVAELLAELKAYSWRRLRNGREPTFDFNMHPNDGDVKT